LKYKMKTHNESFHNFEELKELADQTSPASVSDVMGRLGHHHQHELVGMTAQTPDRGLFAEAVTLRSLPMRADLAEDVVQASGGDRLKQPFDLAVEATTAGKVLVVDTSSWTGATIGGGTKFSRHGLLDRPPVSNISELSRGDSRNFML